MMRIPQQVEKTRRLDESDATTKPMLYHSRAKSEFKPWQHGDIPHTT
jgi:hypothetical protein